MKKIELLSFILLSVVLLIGIYLRYESHKNTNVIRPLSADAKGYYTYAFNLRHNHIYSRDDSLLRGMNQNIKPDALCTPGYPLFLALFIDGASETSALNRILFVQMIISILTLTLSYIFFRGFLPDIYAGISSLLVAFSPHLITLNSYVLTETLFCFFLVLIGCSIRYFVSKPLLWKAALIGILLGAGSLVRPALQYFPIVMIVFFLNVSGIKKGIQYFLLMSFCFLLIYSPWIIRNEITLNRPSDNTLMVSFLHHGMYPDFTYDGIPESYGFPYRFDPRSSDINQNVKTVLTEIKRRFYSEPSRHFKWYLIDKPKVLWSWNMIQGMGDAFVYAVSQSPYFYKKIFIWTHKLMHTLHPRILMLALFGCLMSWIPVSMNFPKSQILIARFSSLILVYFTLVHMVGAPFPRYSIPLRPFLYGMALFVLYQLVFYIRRYREIRRLSVE